MLPDDAGEIKTRMVRRHVAYVHALRSLLRVQNPFKDDDFLAILPDDADGLRAESNLTHALLHRQAEDFMALDDAGRLSEFRVQRLDESILHLLDIQGGCERIKKTPLPRGYGFIAERLIVAFGLTFPFAVVHDLGWVVVPVNVLVCLAFALISEAGRVLEDPFTMFWNGLPLSAISRMIEVNLRQRLGETDLPPMIKASDKGVLM